MLWAKVSAKWPCMSETCNWLCVIVALGCKALNFSTFLLFIHFHILSRCTLDKVESQIDLTDLMTWGKCLGESLQFCGTAWRCGAVNQHNQILSKCLMSVNCKKMVRNVSQSKKLYCSEVALSYEFSIMFKYIKYNFASWLFPEIPLGNKTEWVSRRYCYNVQSLWKL